MESLSSTCSWSTARCGGVRGREPVAMTMMGARTVICEPSMRRIASSCARDEARAAAQQLDVIALELRGHVGVVRGDGVTDAVEQRLDGLVHEIHAPHALAHRVFAQRLARDGAGVHARAADLPVAFDDGHALAGFRGLDGGLLAGGSGADHDDVEDLDGSALEVT